MATIADELHRIHTDHHRRMPISFSLRYAIAKVKTEMKELHSYENAARSHGNIGRAKQIRLERFKMAQELRTLTQDLGRVMVQERDND